ncbi:MAG: hypothetical protein U1F65_04015 [Verrucomicrobiota bacterium]
MKLLAALLLLTATTALAGIETNYAHLGRLILTPFATAPFPHPARANGHTYRTNFYSTAGHYSDSTVALFIPRGFRETGTNDFVFHFHGWNNTVAGTLARFSSIEQFVASGRNAILIVPEGPHNAPDSFGGKLEDTNGLKQFMAEVGDTLRREGALKETNYALGNIVLAGHSGGYHVMSAIVDRGGLPDHVREVWLFDGLYGGTENFLAWSDAHPGRLLNIYTDHGGTTGETSRLMTLLKSRGTAFLATEDANVSMQELKTNHLVFLHSDMTHNDVFAKRKTFQQFLETSCLSPMTNTVSLQKE